MQKMLNLALAGCLATLAVLALPAAAMADGISVELNSVQTDPDQEGTCLLTFDLANESGTNLADFRLTVALRGKGDQTIGTLKDLDFGKILTSDPRIVQFPLPQTGCDAFDGIVVSDTVCQLDGGTPQPCSLEPSYRSIDGTHSFGAK